MKILEGFMYFLAEGNAEFFVVHVLIGHWTLGTVHNFHSWFVRRFALLVR